MFISFEGIDGSGKSTQARLLAAALADHGHTVVSVREPGGTPLGERVRALLLDPEAEIGSKAELLLFSAARAQLVADVVDPALQRGEIVIADRFSDSSTAYQGYGRGLADLGWMDALHSFATGNRLPDRTYLVNLDLATAIERRQSQRPDRMELADADFYERVISGYRQLSRALPERICVVDGVLPVDALHQVILADALSQMSTKLTPR